jgi:selenocysteine lyase/cysteine desulfurase
MEHCRHIETQLLKIGCRILSAQDKDKRSGIVTFSHPSINSEELYKHLMSNQILCAYRGGGVRFSPHFYTSRSSIDRAIVLTRSYILTQPE